MEKKLPQVEWVFEPDFNNLTAPQVYDILKLRQQIFIIEQNCIYPDIDDIDPGSAHLLLYYKSKLTGYCRLVPPGQKFKTFSIGRVAVQQANRENGFGSLLMKRAIGILHENKDAPTIKIEAQLYLQHFYESLGFEKRSDPFDVDGIPHILMVRQSEADNRKTSYGWKP